MHRRPQTCSATGTDYAITRSRRLGVRKFVRRRRAADSQKFGERCTMAALANQCCELPTAHLQEISESDVMLAAVVEDGERAADLSRWHFRREHGTQPVTCGLIHRGALKAPSCSPHAGVPRSPLCYGRAVLSTSGRCCRAASRSSSETSAGAPPHARNCPYNVLPVSRCGSGAPPKPRHTFKMSHDL
jgi:hypothetical protein